MTSGDQERPAPSEPVGADAGDVQATEAGEASVPSGVVDPSGTAGLPAVPQLLAAAPPVLDDAGVIPDMNLERAPPGPDTLGAVVDRASLAGGPLREDPFVPATVPQAQPGARPFAQHEPLAVRVAAEPRELSTLRQAMRRWLAEADVPTDIAEDVVLACGEAAANVIEHAYREHQEGWMEVRVSLVNGTLVASVSDNGRWQPHGSGDGRGRGIRLIGVLMDQVDLHSDDGGTKVTMRRAIDAPLA
jgi:anti-sigma regulatory factor (Ser/Thr protein kinase)